ncbi:OmpA family protein [Aeromonas simiae]|uniref:OmpA family protein n=1 Tax=Aeromonas simiae TaxID=218936 RepID=UPI0005A9259D|nr:OmpA family protein [Aeromonas simiae]
MLPLLWIGLLGLSGCQSLPEGRLNPTQVTVLKAQGFQEIEEGWELGLSSKVLFANESSQLNAQSRASVLQLGKTLKAAKIDWARLDGHTDSYGDAEYNQQLSLRRAQSVADVLEESGMPRANLQVRGLGADFPVESNASRASRSQNRRVAIVITD